MTDQGAQMINNPENVEHLTPEDIADWIITMRQAVDHIRPNDEWYADKVARRPLPSAAKQWSLCIRRPGGGKTFYINDAEAAEFKADPDGYAAKHFGLSVDEYREWVELDGTPLCKGMTKAGTRCRHQVASRQQDAEDWKGLHRRRACPRHET